MVAGIGQLMSGDVPYPTVASLVQDQRCHDHGLLASSPGLLMVAVPVVGQFVCAGHGEI